MRNYYFTSVWVSVSGSGADSVLCSLFGVLYFRLEIIFLFRVLGFGFCLYAFFFLGFCTSISGFWVFVLYYGHQGKLSVFYIVWFYFVFCDSGFCVSVLGSVFLFWDWFSFLGFVVCIFLIGHHIFDRRLSVNLSTRGNLTRLSISWQFR